MAQGFRDHFLEIDGHFQKREIGVMQVRLRPCKVGDVVTVKNCEIYFYLPDELPDRTQAVVVGRDSGRIIVQALGREWNLPMQCVDNGADYFCNGQWLDQHDRRAQKELAAEVRRKTLEEMRKKYPAPKAKT